MKRTLVALCLCLCLVSGVALAGEAARGNAFDAPPLCPKAAAKAASTAPVAGTAAPAPSASRTRGGGGTAATRLTSPRWHSLLPGMFR